MGCGCGKGSQRWPERGSVGLAQQARGDAAAPPAPLGEPGSGLVWNGNAVDQAKPRPGDVDASRA